MDQNNSSFNLVDVAGVLKKRIIFIGFFVAMAGLTAAALVFWVIPQRYKSTTVIVAANPLLADKSKLFNENIEGLYSTFGGEDDLNRLYGIAGLDTTYKLLVDKFDLVSYYNIKGDNAALNKQKAIAELKEDVELIKNDLYQLKISATTKDKVLSASIVNEMAAIVQKIAQATWNQSYAYTIEKLAVASRELEEQYNVNDSSQTEMSAKKKQGILEQLMQNEKIMNQYKIALASNTPALLILEKAYPAAKPHHPKKLLIIVGALIASFTFIALAVLIFERRQ